VLAQKRLNGFIPFVVLFDAFILTESATGSNTKALREAIARLTSLTDWKPDRLSARRKRSGPVLLNVDPFSLARG